MMAFHQHFLSSIPNISAGAGVTTRKYSKCGIANNVDGTPCVVIIKYEWSSVARGNCSLCWVYV